MFLRTGIFLPEMFSPKCRSFGEWMNRNVWKGLLTLWWINSQLKRVAWKVMRSPTLQGNWNLVNARQAKPLPHNFSANAQPEADGIQLSLSPRMNCSTQR